MEHGASVALAEQGVQAGGIAAAMSPLAERRSARCAAAFHWNRAHFVSGGVERAGDIPFRYTRPRARLARREIRFCHAQANFEIGSSVCHSRSAAESGIQAPEETSGFPFSPARNAGA